MKYGAAHVRGLYTVPNGSGTQFTDGCNAIWDLGLRTLKVYLTSDYADDYALQTSWSSSPTTLKQLTQTTQYSTQLSRGWDTIIFTTFTFANKEAVTNAVTNWWRVGCTNANLDAEYDEIYELATHLLTTYNNSGTTFILQNWEGDWAYMDAFDPDTYVDRKYVEYYAAFAAIRQKAVSDARRDTAHTNVTVLHAFEVNRVLDVKDRPGSHRILADLATRFTPDVVSYSAYDSTIVKMGWAASFDAWKEACEEYYSLAFRLIRAAWPGAQIQVGEFGFPENEAPVGRDIGEMIEVVRNISVQYDVAHFIYWEVFDNEAGTPPATYRGYWLLEPDGSLSVAGNKFYAYGHGA